MKAKSVVPPDDRVSSFLAGGGEMGRRMRDLDWGSTPLGPLDAWPQSLRTAVGMMLSSRYPMFIAWGEELSFLYNDGYAPIFGQKHPAALGRPFAEIWAEIWEDVRPLVDQAIAGEPTWSEDLLLFMERSGYREETYYTFSYSPIRDESGGVGGMLCACTETTGRVVGDRRLALLRAIGTRTIDARDWHEAARGSAAALATNLHDLPFALIYVSDPDSGRLTLAGAAGIEPGHEAAPEVVDPEAGPWRSGKALRSRDGIRVIEDLPSRIEAPLPTGAWEQPPARAALVPIAATGHTGRGGMLVVGLNPFRTFDDDYRNFLTLAAAQISACIASAQAYEEEKNRAEALAEIDRAKTVFFSNVSHEFRTPLTLMLGPVEELLSAAAVDLPPNFKTQLDVVHRNGLRLLRLVSTLLDFSRLEAGRIRARYQPTDLATLTAELASNFRSAIERAGMGLRIDCPPLPEPVYVDREMWEKIVLNLLSNAFKFTLEGEIEVSLSAAGPEETESWEETKGGEGRVELRVRDTGTGIPAEQMPRLFERFHRIENARSRTQEGSGIGLAMVQELVKLHGGTIAAHSVVGQGSTFVVSIPAGCAHLPRDQVGGGEPEHRPGSTASGATPFVEEALRWLPGEDAAGGVPEEQPLQGGLLGVDGAEPGGAEGRPRVLVVDDNADMRAYLVRLLGVRFRVESFADGDSALAAALDAVHAGDPERAPELILADVMMPRLDGFGLLRAVREDPLLREIPVILLSAKAGEEARVEGAQSGADDYLVKPFSARELLARVDAQIEMARLRREATEQVRRREERFRAIANTAPAMLWVTAPDGRLAFISRGWCEHTGQSEAEAMGEDGFGWLETMHPEDRGEVCRVLGAANDRHEPFSLDCCLRHRGGESEYRWAIVAGRPRFGEGGEFLGFVGSVIDVHERKQSEEALREADRRKDEFLATLSHELRGPLAPLRNTIEIMKRAGDDGDVLDEARATIDRQVTQLVRLVDDLLDVSRITRNKLELRREPVGLGPIVESAIESCRPLVEELEHELEVILPSEPLTLHADPARVTQILSNLLHNACKYTERGGRIRLSAERRGGEVAIEVSDTGIGIPGDQLDSVFEMFIQGDLSSERPHSGLGIGLTLVRQLVQMHGGTVEASSEGPGRGSQFVVRLPLSREQREAPRQESDTAGTNGPAGRRILVVDDNPDTAGSLVELLRITGHDTDVAYDGLEAVTAADRFRPDVILLDLGLPKLNGVDAARRIRERAWGRSVLLVALTGWGSEEDRRKTREAGFDHHLVKPLDYDVLMRVIAGRCDSETPVGG